MKFTDMMSNEVEIDFPPKRIVSIVPSQTELLYDLGLDSEVVGITKFCVHPVQWFKTKKRVGGTKQLYLDEIRSLKPDLIIANKEENEKVQIELLTKEFPVWVSDIKTVSDALKMIRQVGLVTNKKVTAEVLAARIEDAFTALQKASFPKRVAYFIWYKPWMCTGRDTFINSMIEAMGWQNVFKEKSRYPEVSLAELKIAQPEIILLSSEPFPFKEKHAAEIAGVVSSADIRLVDGEMFSWYGSRMLKAIPYFQSFLTER
ncbi:MAG TPA: helical backbone metal receptor [Flavipsychrobacter sp.]|nr:helical backbone metal receptor [Flavipsychrobacter sp.]